VSYDEHLQQMTRMLTDLARAGRIDLTEAEVDIALTARRSVLDLLTAVHAETTGLGRTRGPTRIGDLEAHPVAALGQALAQHPRPVLDHAPSDALSRRTETAVGETWRQIARHAMLAGHHWTAGRGPTPDEATRWKSVSDIAATSGLLAALDHRLAEAIERVAPDRVTVIAALRRGTTSGLGVSARETTRLSAAGPIAAAGPDRSATPAARPAVLVARSAAELPATQRRLAALLATGRVRAERLPPLATAIATCGLRIRDGIAVDDPVWSAVRSELTEHARLLDRAAVRSGRLVSIDAAARATGLRPPPEPELSQAGEAYRGLQRFGLLPGSDRHVLGDYVQALADSTRALSEAVDRAIADGRWLVPDPAASPGDPVWASLRPTTPAPAAVKAVRMAAARADTLSAATQAAMTRTGGLRAPTRERSTVRPGDLALPAATSPHPSIDQLAVRRPHLPSHPVVVAAPARRR
jgi:hypothetical protein